MLWSSENGHIIKLPGRCFRTPWTDIPEIRMFAPTVREHLDVIHHLIPRLLPRHIIALRRALTLQAAEKTALRPLSKHSPLPLMLHAIPCSAEGFGGMTGILRLVMMMEQASTGLATTQRHLQRIPTHCVSTDHGPPHDLAGIQVPKH